MKNRLRELLDSGEPALGTQLRFGSPAIAELFGAAGFDFVVIDGEHAPQTPSGIQAQIQGLGSTGATPLVRLGKTEMGLVGLMLDMGAMGIVAPMVSTAEEARAGAEACRYPPAGTRGFGPSRAAAYGFDEGYFNEANDSVVYIPIIETVEAVENIGDILELEGVDAYIVGEYDLSISLGVPLEFDSPKFRDAVKRVREAGRRTGTPAAAGVDAADSEPQLRRLLDEGYRLFLVDGDEWMLHAACKQVVDGFTRARR